MDIQKFQEKLAEICELGEKSGKILKPQQIKECFGEMDLDKSQLIKILQYLKLKGITIEGAEVALHTSGEEQETEPEEQEQKVPLTPEEEEYLKEYLEGLEEQKAGEGQTELYLKYLPAAAKMAAEMNCEEIFLADLIQEANLALLAALKESEPLVKDDTWMRGRIRSGILHAIEEQTQQKFRDDYLVSKVENLESAVKELTDDDDTTRFTIDELAVILDMNVDEIRDVLRLTGDDK